jgi:TonB family protein
MFRLMNRVAQAACCLLIVSAGVSAQTGATAKNTSASAQPAPVETDRMRDGLIGPVRRVRTEVAKLSSADGRASEGKHFVLEVVAYDIKGNKIENQYFPIAGSTLTGKEVYKYDEKGNISEMTLVNPDGSLLSREVYKYEFDFAGNWNKMTTSVAVVEGGRVTFEPTEVTYRSIMYYLDENMARMMTPNASPTVPPVVNPVSSTPAPVLSNSATGRVVRPDTKGKRQESRRNQTPVLPSVSTNVNNVTTAGPDEKTLVADSEYVPKVMLDTEPPLPGPKPILKPISGGVLNGTALSLPPPIYPEAAKRMRMSGVVEVDVVLDESGRVISAVAKSGPPSLRDAAINAALKARFSPTKLSGQPVKVSGIINYKFALVQ